MGPGEHLVGMGQQQGQQIKLQLGQRYPLAVEGYATGFRVQAESAPGVLLPLGGCRRVPGAAQDSFHPQQDHLEREGLGNVIIGFQLEGLDLGVLSVQSGEHDDGNLGFLADLAADGIAIHLGHHQVQQDQGKGLPVERLQPLDAIGCQCDLVPCFREQSVQNRRNGGFVFYH